MISLTLTIVIATVAVTIVSFRNARLFRAFLFSVHDVVSRNQGWRLVTSGFVHADWLHLGFNMYTLYIFGSDLELMIAPWRFGIVYFLGIIVGSFASMIIHRDAPDYHAVGASGGVCAVIAAFTVLEPTTRMIILPIPFGIPAWVVGSLFIVFTIVGAKRRMDNIGHEAHLGGTLTGMAVIAAFFPDIALQHILYIAAILGAAFAAWFFTRRMQTPA